MEKYLVELSLKFYYESTSGKPNLKDLKNFRKKFRKDFGCAPNVFADVKLFSVKKT